MLFSKFKKSGVEYVVAALDLLVDGRAEEAMSRYNQKAR